MNNISFYVIGISSILSVVGMSIYAMVKPKIAYRFLKQRSLSDIMILIFLVILVYGFIEKLLD